MADSKVLKWNLQNCVIIKREPTINELNLIKYCEYGIWKTHISFLRFRVYRSIIFAATLMESVVSICGHLLVTIYCKYPFFLIRLFISLQLISIQLKWMRQVHLFMFQFTACETEHKCSVIKL